MAHENTDDSTCLQKTARVLVSGWVAGVKWEWGVGGEVMG